MGSRMDKYSSSDIPSRSERNQELYKQIYNAYDEFDNLVVPSNAKEIDLEGLKKEISGRDDYKKRKDYSDITNNKVVRKEIVQEEQKKENEIYDINELLNKAVKDNKKEDEPVTMMSNDSYLKILKLEEVETNIVDVYGYINKDLEDENDELLKTANLSLEILSDLKGDNDNTMVDAPIKDELIEEADKQFYSNTYKFSKSDFDGNTETDIDVVKNSDYDSDEDDEDDYESDNKFFFFKILLMIFGIGLVVVIGIYLFSYFSRA